MLHNSTLTLTLTFGLLTLQACESSSSGGRADAASGGSDVAQPADGGESPDTGGGGALDADGGEAPDTSGTEEPDVAVVADVPLAEPEGAKVVSDGGGYFGWLAGLESGMSLGTNGTATLVIRTADGQPVEDATLAVRFIHAAMGHGGPKAPKVAGSGGVYTITDLLPSMGGDWEVQVDVKRAGSTETLVFPVVVD